MTRQPTPDQLAVLENQSRARVRVVKAAPGSGKTWLVAEVIQRELKEWKKPGSGIAALSFTRVGSEEIRKAVGRDLAHPHFVGTIDAFLFRYVVRPFFKACTRLVVEPRLLPEDMGARHWTQFGTVDEWFEKAGKDGEVAKTKRSVSIFECQYVGESDDKEKTPILQQQGTGRRSARILPDGLAKLVRDEKRRVMKEKGLLTHSDAARLASWMLAHENHGEKIRAEVARRFPFVVVDELQDTGYFLGKCLRLILSGPTVNGLAVGDPDQAIFEFTGARPEHFDTFKGLPGAQEFALTTTRRCPLRVAAAAKHLKDTGGDFHPSQEATGRAVLLSYDSMVDGVQRLVEHLRATTSQTPKVIARASDTVHQLNAGNSKREPVKLDCPALTHMHLAVISLREGRSGAALGSGRSAILRAAFDEDRLDDEQLAGRGVEAERWHRLVTDSVLAAASCTTDKTLYEWQLDVAKAIAQLLSAFVPPVFSEGSAKRLKPKKKKGFDSNARDQLPGIPGSSPVGAQTVHAVKGETHDTTVFVCKPAGNTASCPSEVWWSTKDVDRERKRIAYVAMTRPKGDLFVCVSKDCFENLKSKRKDFFDAFEAMSIDEFIAAAAAPVEA